MELDISKMSIVELKAVAYDELVKKQIAEQNLNTVNEQLKKLIAEEAKLAIPPKEF